jgi:hypothetical protein
MPYKFDSTKTLNFHKKYSKKVHHLRFFTEETIKYFKRNKNFKNTEYLYSVVNEFNSNGENIIFQGDSWAEFLTNPDNGDFGSMNYVKKFSTDNNIGFINAGVVSFSPTLMQVQLDVLEKDFNIKPSIVIAYIDQTDLGDENCRYKNKRIFQNDNVIAVNPEKYSGNVFDFTKIYAQSEIFLSNNNKLIKTYNLLNFRIKYKYKKNLGKNINKFKRIIKFGYKNRKAEKCYWPEIQNYLTSGSKEEINYFKTSVKNYIKYIEQKDYIKKIFIITFPHKNHLPSLYESKELYKHNVSDLVDEIAKNNNKIFHLNFSKRALSGNIVLKKEDYLKNDPSSHLTPLHYKNFFIKEVISYVSKNIF